MRLTAHIFAKTKLNKDQTSDLNTFYFTIYLSFNFIQTFLDLYF